jgi:cell division protein FtsI (penicillin-binding protein 3)
MRDNKNYGWRLYFIICLLMLAVTFLLWRLIDLNIFNRSFLVDQSNQRAVRIVSTPAYRGMITDRHGIPLAISTPVDSVWANPQMFQASWLQFTKLSKLLDMRISEIKRRVNQNSDREFVYLKRGLPPDVADKIKTLNISGLFFQREYRRYYPEGEVSTHVVGFTNIDDQGQEGLELGYDNWLRGIPGKERVIKDRLGYIIAIINVLSQPIQGHDLVLSIDDRIQYLAYKDLKEAVQQYHAEAGSVVILNPKTGEILAMANVPSYNPNQRPLVRDNHYRNHAVTDVFEPGSPIKTFSVVNALESGKFTPDTTVDTNPGWLMIQGNTIHDVEANNGILTLAQVLQKSSNIGIAKVTLSLPSQNLFNLLRRVGFGQSTNSGYPGEVSGSLVDRWRPIDIATVSFGYGLSVTALQLAHAYSIIANNGLDVPVTFLKQDKLPVGKQVLDPKITQQVSAMLETVVEKGGTATEAAIPGYRVGGKTGTAYIATSGSYDKKHYNSSFVGIVPVSNPQLITVVVLNNVGGDIHFGGQVAAPVYANITGAALRILGIPPDNLMVADIHN